MYLFPTTIQLYIYIYIYIYIGCFTTVKTKQRPLRSSLLTLFSFSLQIILMYVTKYRETISWTMEKRIFFVNTYYEIKSFKIVQERHARKFNFEKFQNRNQIFKLVKNRAIGSSSSGSSIIIQTLWSNVHALSTTMRPGVVAPDRVLFMCQIELFDI